MFSRVTTLRNVARVAIGAGAATAALLGTSATAGATPPNCTAADRAGIRAGVSASMSAYLFTHPAVNDFFTSLKDLPRDETRAKIQQYGDSHPQEQAEVRAIRQPMIDFKNRCGVVDLPMPLEDQPVPGSG